MRDDTLVELESTAFQPFPRSRMARVKDRHIILLRHPINRREETGEILLRVDVFLPMGGEQDILPFFQSQP